MKPFRLFAITCLASAFVVLAPAQQMDDIAALRAKAEKGNTLAQYNLGLAYAEGRGVPVDRLEAYVWLSLARENGAHGKALDNLISTLDKASLEMAQQRLADHKGTPARKVTVVSAQPNEPEIVATIKTSGPAAANADTAALTKQIATLTADKKQLSEELAKAWKEIDALNAAMKKSESDARTASSQASAADQESAAKFNREVEASLNRTNELKASLEKKLAAVQAELDQTKGELANQTQLNAKLAAAESARLTPSAEMGAIRDQLSTAQTQNNQLTTELAAVRANETKLHDTVAQLEQEKNRLAAIPAQPDLSNKVAELESTVADSTQKLATAKKDQAELQRQLAESAAELKVAHKAGEVAALKIANKAGEESAQIRRERDELSNRVTVLASENSGLRTDQQQLQQSLADVRKNETELHDTIAQLEKEKASLAALPAHPDLSTKVSELESALADATQKLATANKDDAEMQRQLVESVAALKIATNAGEENAQLRRERDELSNRVTLLASENAGLRTDHKQLQQSLADVRKNETELQGSIAQLEKEKASLAASPVHPDLSNKVSELESALTDSTQKLATANKDEAELQRQLVESAAALKIATKTGDESAQLRRERDELSNRVTLLASENAGLRTEHQQLQQGLADFRRNETKLQDTIAQLEKEKAGLAASPAQPDLSSKVSELESALADSTQKLATSNKDEAELQRQLVESAAALEAAIKEGKESAQLRRERDELSNRVTLLASENAELRTDRQQLQQNLADAGKQVHESGAAASRIKELETQSTALQASIADARTQVVALKSSLAAKPETPAYPDLSGKVRELESHLAKVNLQAETTNKRNVEELYSATAQITRLQAALAAKPAAPTVPDLSGRVRDLETQLAAATTEVNRAKQEVAAVTKAREADSKNQGPTYPNLAGRVVELQTALADTKRDLADAQTALHTSEQARATLAASSTTTAPAPEPAATGTETAELQKQLAASEDKLATALRGYAMLQREHDAQIESATKSADTVTTERNSLATQVTALSGEIEILKTSVASLTASAQAEAARATESHAALERSTAESYAALQRSSAQNATDLAAARALLQQVQGAYTVLANENYQLKTRLAATGTPPVAAGTSATSGPTVPAPAVATARIHVIAVGDTLSRISQRYYNTPTRWQEIYKANAAKLGPNGVLRVGVELVIP